MSIFKFNRKLSKIEKETNAYNSVAFISFSDNKYDFFISPKKKKKGRIGILK